MASKKPSGAAAFARFRHAEPGTPFHLAAIEPGEKPCSSGKKAQDRSHLEDLALELDGLQNLLFANGRQKMLVVLQGPDTSGKDGTLRVVFGRMTPLGVRTVGWKAPTEGERAHDFLWRIHAQVPRAGELVVFNRSHYEDVLVPWVLGEITEDVLEQRYAQINDFERLLTQTGTVILKFMLHISKDEQRERLQERIDDPAKRWKFQRGDLEVRKHWDAYQQAYARAISATGTPWAPWIVVPADSKMHRNLMVATVLKAALQDLHLTYPDDPSIASIQVT